MVRELPTVKPMVLLIGNYLPDQQQSMLRFNEMMLHGLRTAGVEAELLRPPALFGKVRALGATAAKWFGYIDKFILFRVKLARRLAAHPTVVHICDHSNAMYAPSSRRTSPTIVTCHDMLAVRGGLGEETDCPASFTGKFLQRWILRSLRSANHIACASPATAADVERLVARKGATPSINVVYLGLNYPYTQLKRETALTRLGAIDGLQVDRPFVLHVGSNMRMKNREGVLRIFAKCAEPLNAQMVFVGERLNESLVAAARELGIERRIVQVPNASNELLEACYNCAYALLYPSRFEGFGWPITEAQSCGCPVVCSSAGPMADVAGSGALLHPPEDEEGFANDLLRLADPHERAFWSAKGLENAKRFSAERMISEYCELYRSLAAA